MTTDPDTYGPAPDPAVIPADLAPRSPVDRARLSHIARYGAEPPGKLPPAREGSAGGAVSPGAPGRAVTAARVPGKAPAAGRPPAAAHPPPVERPRAPERPAPEPAGRPRPEPAAKPARAAAKGPVAKR